MPKSRTPEIILACFAALIFIGGLFGTYYFYNKNNETTIVVNAKQAELAALQKKIKQYPKLVEDLNRMESEEQRLSNFIPTKEEQKEFIYELEELAHQTGIAITQCDIKSDVKRLAKLPQYEVYQWTLMINGDFRSLMNFLNALIVNKRAAMVSDLKISARNPSEKDKTDAPYVLGIEMTLDLLSKSDQEKVAK